MAPSNEIEHIWGNFQKIKLCINLRNSCMGYDGKCLGSSTPETHDIIIMFIILLNTKLIICVEWGIKLYEPHHKNKT